MSEATCKTCGGTPQHHAPSNFDRDGIGHPDHKVQSPVPEEKLKSEIYELVHDLILDWEGVAPSAKLSALFNGPVKVLITKLLVEAKEQSDKKIVDNVFRELRQIVEAPDDMVYSVERTGRNAIKRYEALESYLNQEKGK